MIQRAAASALLCLLLLARGASAHAIKCDHPSQPTSQPQTLQQILDGLVVSGPGIDASAPLNIELWTNSAGPMTAQVVVDKTSKSQSVSFGMYDPDNVGNHAFLLPSGVTPADVATVVFNADQSITVHGPINASSSPFDGPFGFFVKTSLKGGEDDQGENDDDQGENEDGHHGGWNHKWDKWSRTQWAWGWDKHKGDEGDEGEGNEGMKQFLYTQDALNPGGLPHAVVFQGDGHTVIQLPGLAPGLFLPSQFLIAWETGLGDANDGQFNDFLVLVSNIVPVTVPEPAFALLLGISSLALVCGRRERRALK